MSTPTTPTPQPPADKKVADDPLSRKLRDSLKVAIEGNEVKSIEPAKLGEPPKIPDDAGVPLTLSEMAAIKAEEKKAPKPPEPAPPEQTPPPAAPPAEKKEEKPVKPVVVEKPEPPPLVVPPAPPKPQAATPPVEEKKPEPPAPAAPSVDPDAAYIAGLSEEQREELELAKYAAEKFPEHKNRYAETLAYFKKVDQFQEQHADSSPDSEEFRNFVDKNQPKWSAGQRRKVETQRIKEEAVAEAEQKLSEKTKKELEEIRKRQHEIETTPKIEKAMKEFESRMTGEDLKVPETIDPLVLDIAKRISEVGYTEASKEFSVEVPIIQAHQSAAREFLNISNGLAQIDTNNPTHRWLGDFVSQQTAILKSRPEQLTQGGKTFLSRQEYREAMNKDKTKAEAEHWTLSDDMVLEMIKANAIISVDQQIKNMEAGGYKRERPVKKVSNSETLPTPTPPEEKPKPAEIASPKAGASSVPGPIADGVKSNPDNWISQRFPGLARR